MTCAPDEPALERSTRPAVTVIIPARNAAATLASALAGLAAQDFEGLFETLVVDDHSTDMTREVASNSQHPTTLVCPSEFGAAGARNAGAATAQAPIIAFIDADCRPHPDWLRVGVEAMEAADLLQGAVEPVEPLRGPFDRTLEVREPSVLFESANLFVRRELFDRLGGFEQWIGGRHERPFGEDTWFGWRARRAGARIVFCERARVTHAVFPGDWTDLVRERWRLRYFPPLIARIPELRQALCGHYFLSPRTTRVDLAVLATASCVLGRRSSPIVGVAPYVRYVWSVSRPWGRRRAPFIALAHATADTVGLAALALGSVRSGTLVI